MDEDFIEDFVFIETEDVDWQELHAKILEERKQKNLTITDFVVSCGLSPDRPYFKQLSSKTRKRLHPSKRRNSAGREFRDAVTKYFAENKAPTVTPKSLENVLRDWSLDNRPLLQDSYISRIELVNSHSTDLKVYVCEKCVLSNDDIQEMLMEDAHISHCLAGSVLRITSRSYSHLL